MKQSVETSPANFPFFFRLVSYYILRIGKKGLLELLDWRYGELRD